MKTAIRSILVSLLLIIGAPAYSESGSEVLQIFRCEFNDEGTSEDEVLELAAAWLKAAKQTKGGANMTLVIRFPVAVGMADEGDFTWVISTPTFAEWGQFTDAYEGSPVEKVDDQLFDNLADCGQSSIWEGTIMK
jgi:hypothetical protein